MPPEPRDVTARRTLKGLVAFVRMTSSTGGGRGNDPPDSPTLRLSLVTLKAKLDRKPEGDEPMGADPQAASQGPEQGGWYGI